MGMAVLAMTGVLLNLLLVYLTATHLMPRPVASPDEPEQRGGHDTALGARRDQPAYRTASWRNNRAPWT